MPFAIGIVHTKTEHNVGTLMRSAHNFGAAMVFTIGRRYTKQSSDTENAAGKIPILHFPSWEEYRDAAPFDWTPIAVELSPGAKPLVNFAHPKRAVYLLGPEDGSLGRDIRERCKDTIVIPSSSCLNVAVAGSIVMYDRIAKEEREAIKNRRASLAQLVEHRTENPGELVRLQREALEPITEAVVRVWR